MPKKSQPVFVTKATLPAKEKFLELVSQVYDRAWLTNQGPLCAELEKQLKNTLASEYLILCSNGTLGLQLAIRALGLNGKKILTTPFTYVATLTALMWEGCEPVFVDIDSESLCMSPILTEKILAKDQDIAGIVPVHVYGNACDVYEFAELGRQYDIKILYDAAHAFGSKLNGKSLLTYGDAAICSFHATKLYHTVEGGCVIAHSPQVQEQLNLFRAFGHKGDEYLSLGINAKLSEMHAAMGLALLPEVPKLIDRRRNLANLYDNMLNIGKNELKKPKFAEGLEWNYAYYPIIFSSEKSLLKINNALQEKNIFCRRYFFPSLTKMPYIKDQSAPICEDIASRVLCLPFWPDMPVDIIQEISEIILKKL